MTHILRLHHLTIVLVTSGLLTLALPNSVGANSTTSTTTPVASPVVKSGPAICYRTSVNNDSPLATHDEPSTHTVWCYRQLKSPAGSRLIYQIDEKGQTRPELSLLVEADGTITHASRHAGQLTYHKLNYGEFNPLGAPLTPPDGAERIDEPIAPASAGGPDRNIEAFQEHGHISVRYAHVNAGVLNVTVPEASMPWRGYWFPYKTQRMYKDEAPLVKYDKFITRRAANTNPDSLTWEIRNHSRGRSWSGHCNGWAAAAIMTPEPKKAITDPITKITFSVTDQKALLTEANYCPKIVFYGRRNYGKPENDPSDIHPTTFHNVLTYFVGELNKPVLVDLMATPAVQNSVITGYTMNIRRLSSNTFDVDARVKVHLYDDELNEEPGVARSVTKKYRYILHTDSSGRVSSGSWISANPDFLWVPLSPGDCKDKNPMVDSFWVDEIFRVSK